MKIPNILDKQFLFLIGRKGVFLFNKYFVKCLVKKYPLAPTFLHLPYMTIVNFEIKIPVDLKSKKKIMFEQNKNISCKKMLFYNSRASQYYIRRILICL